MCRPGSKSRNARTKFVVVRCNMPDLEQYGIVMPPSERMSTPECRCGNEMELIAPQIVPCTEETYAKIYVCAGCGHEMRVTVWGTDLCEMQQNTMKPAISL
jgi:hypothetical protein